jgi:hypothetical protein
MIHEESKEETWEISDEELFANPQLLLYHPVMLHLVSNMDIGCVIFSLKVFVSVCMHLFTVFLTVHSYEQTTDHFTRNKSNQKY